MSSGDFKVLSRRTVIKHITERNEAFNIAKNPNYDRYHCRLASMVCKCFDKKSTAAADTNKSATLTRTEINSENLQLAEELHKPIIRKSKKYKVYSFLGIIY